MTAAAKAAAAAVIASAATATVILGTGMEGGERTAARSAAVERPRAGIAERSPMDGLLATPAEMEFLRAALATERARRADATIRAEDSGLDILRRVVESGADVTDLLRDYDSARSHVRPRAGPIARIEATGDLTPVDLSKAAAGSVVVEFGPGTFRLDRSDWHNLRENTESLEVRGAGMDRTTLVATSGGLFHVVKALVHLRVADLTFDGGEREDLILDIRGEAAAAFERVRFRAAGSVMAMGGAFLLFQGCEFLGGFGSSTNECALSARGDVIAGFQGCLFSEIAPVLMGWSGAARGSVVQLEGCTFENSSLADSRLLHRDRPEFVVRVRGGRVHFGASDLPEAERLNTWGAGYAAELTATQFGPEIPRCTIGDLLRVLERYRAADGSLAGAIQLVAANRAGAEMFWIWPVGPDGAQRNPIIVRLRDGGLEELPRGRRGSPGTGDLSLVTRCKPIAELLRGASLAPDMGCTRVSYAVMHTNGEARGVLHVGDSWPAKTVLDGVTGERIRTP